MVKKYLNTVLPISAEVGKLFGKETVEEVRSELKEKQHYIEGHDLIPGAVEIPLEDIINAGFKIKFFLKDDTGSAVDKFNSGIIVASIQHEDTSKATLVDGLSFNFDPKSEVEISTLISFIVKDMVPEAFGKEYDLKQLAATSSDKIRSILEEAALNKKIREEKLKQYEANPELARKHTKKALEKLAYKHKEIMKAKSSDQEAILKFQQSALTIIGEIFGMNNIKTFEDLKQIPEFKAELDKGGSFAEILEKFSLLIDAKTRTEENLKIAEAAASSAE